MNDIPSTPYKAVEQLRDALASATFVTNDEAAARAEAAVAQIDDYILPRLNNADAPLLGVVGGSTGSGKSTLVNGIVGTPVTTPGVIRPTTRQPVLVAHPDDTDWFNSGEVLPGLAREQGDPGANPSATSLRVVSTDSITPGLALLDAPDFDSIDDRNRELAGQLLAAADLWLFVTTPARYADNLVWNFLNDAAARNIEVIVVLNRVDEDAMATVPDDLRRMMSEAGLGEASFFVVPHSELVDGQLPAAAVTDLQAHLQALAADAAARREMAAKTVAGAVEKLGRSVSELSAEKQREEERAAQLAEAFDNAFARAGEQVIDATSDGNLLRKEVMQRWQDFVGTSDAFRAIERWYSLALDKIGSFITGKPAPVREVETEIEEGLHAVIVDAAQTAAARSWGNLGTLAPRLRDEADPALSEASTDIEEQAAQLVRDWQSGLMDYIQDNAADKRMKARVLSAGLNVLTVALMVVVFASTAGLTGGEVAIAGGSAVVGQKLLETIFGEDNVRRMAKKARQDLNERITELFGAERARFDAVTGRLTGGTASTELDAALERAVTAAKEQA
ncbi:ABC transporter [Corynebacterium incognita]|uniref:ABC transporter n=1 Tax=Corynebacterium incognita TaxID=2754725 RepID=UPI001FE3C0A5|nr:ABC transporter [Corynebacterium incognita]